MSERENATSSVRRENIDVEFRVTLQKDLLPGEVVCPDCGGSGLQVANNRFGLRNEERTVGDPFPYKRQSITGCASCYIGTQKACDHCGKLMGRRYRCDCDGAREARREERRQKELDRWNALEQKFSLQEAVRRFEMLYVENNGEFVDRDGLIDYLHDYDGDLGSLRVYGTKKVRLSFDAYSILENACEELHEDAFDEVSGLVGDLQSCLDDWIERNGVGTASFEPDYSVGVVVRHSHEDGGDDVE